MTWRVSGRRSLVVLGVPLWAVGAAYGQLADGDFNALSVGNPPDCTIPAGAWQFPANYATALVCEVDPTMFTIVATSSFDPTRTGNSLALLSADAVNNIHLPNVMPAIITPPPGAIVRVEFDIWVGATGGGGSMYIGYDAGGGGFSNATDRGPQLSWWDTGQISYNANGVNNFVVQSFNRNVWQHVKLDIRFDVHNFDFYWTPAPAQPVQTLGTALGFRAATPPSSVDRITIAHFGGTPGINNNNSFFDNFTFTVVGGGPVCYPDCNGDHALNVNDFICFQGAFAAMNLQLADCNHDNALNVNDFVCFQSAFAAGCSQL